MQCCPDSTLAKARKALNSLVLNVNYGGEKQFGKENVSLSFPVAELLPFR